MRLPVRLLVMDTCGAAASVVLAEDGRVISVETLPGRSASERLVTVVRELLEGAGWRLGELAAIGVVHGPGSFTGIRVGVSAAKGLSEASGVGLVAVSRLEVLARVGAGSVMALDAGRGEFYVRHGEVDLLRTRAELVALGGSVTVFESAVAESLQAEMEVRLEAMPGAAAAVGVVTKRVAAGLFDDAATLDAHYVRGSEGLYGRVAG